MNVTQVEAAQSAGGVSAFSKELNKLHKPSKCLVEPCPSLSAIGFPRQLSPHYRVANHMSLAFIAQADVDELEHLIFQYQQIEDDEQGDLLDDFVLSATLVRFRSVTRTSLLRINNLPNYAPLWLNQGPIQKLPTML